MFKIKELGPLAKLLGVEVVRERAGNTIGITYCVYIYELFKRQIYTGLSPYFDPNRGQAGEGHVHYSEETDIQYTTSTCRQHSNSVSWDGKRTSIRVDWDSTKQTLRERRTKRRRPGRVAK